MKFTEEQTSLFIQRYAHLYFKPNKDEEAKYKEELKAVHIKKMLNYTSDKAEKYAMSLLENGEYNEYALAWKAGKLDLNEKDKPCYTGFEKDGAYIIGERSLEVNKAEFESYLRFLNDNKAVIVASIEKEDIRNAYKTALRLKPKSTKSEVPKNLGPVNIINALFFISKGKAPIYDSFAHKAVRALAMGLAPNKVYLGLNHGRTEIASVELMYDEYMSLLKKLFPEYIYRKGRKEFIPRELDQALWVYGHCTEEWKLDD